MTSRDLKRWKPGGLDPAVHNAIVARRKRYRRIARQLRASTQGATRSFRNLAASADRAADSLRKLGQTLAGLSAPEMIRFTGGERVERIVR